MEVKQSAVPNSGVKAQCKASLQNEQFDLKQIKMPSQLRKLLHF